MAWFSSSWKHLPKKMRKKLQRLKNRWLFRVIMAHKALKQQEELRTKQQGDAMKAIRGERQARRLGRTGRKRGRERPRDRDDGVKKSAKEEQLWQLKSNAMKERTRQRKKEAMDRWQMVATSGGAFRGR